MPLIDATATLLLIDLQQRLVPAISGAQAMLANARILSQAANLLGMPVVVTEQYPKGLGRSLPGLTQDRAQDRAQGRAQGRAQDRAHDRAQDQTQGQALAKVSFDACATSEILDRLAPARSLIVAGCESHVCVLQTVLTLLAQGRAVYVAADATGSRSTGNHQAALTRMAAHGAEIVTTEMILFEVMRSAEHPAFRQISAMVK